MHNQELLDENLSLPRCTKARHERIPFPPREWDEKIETGERKKREKGMEGEGRGKGADGPQTEVGYRRRLKGRRG